MTKHKTVRFNHCLRDFSDKLLGSHVCEVCGKSHGPEADSRIR